MPPVFARQISQAYAELADAYYLDAREHRGSLASRVSKDAIRITIPVLMRVLAQAFLHHVAG